MTECPSRVLAVMRELVADVDRDVDRFAYDRAYQTAGGPLLSLANRVGWPDADRVLDFVLAIRRLANRNHPPDDVQTERRAHARTVELYEQQREELTRWLTTD
jgi:hypothetical protein